MSEDKSISKIELNPPFDFLLKDQAKKIHTLFPNLVFEHYPVKSTKKDMFEHLMDLIDSPSFGLVENLLKSVPTHKILTK